MISRTGRHHIRALAVLAKLPPGGFAGAAGVAHAIEAPPNYLGKLLQAMARSGLVESRKGAGGGFRLAHDPASISLLDVLGPIDQIEQWNGCVVGRNECSKRNPCAAHGRWVELRDAYLRLLSETTLADVARDDPADAGKEPDHER